MVHSPLPPSGLLGRHFEREALDGVLDGIREGQSRVLVLRGEAGVGKTALLEHLLQHATGCRVLRAAGVEAEMELPFAGLHALCAPFLPHLDVLPPPQRQALSIAFGLDAGPAPDRFMVGLAVLSLLADAAETEPLLCVIDDAQWLDSTSAQALAFVARRLLAERVGLVFAQREPADERLAGLPELHLSGISERHARLLLDATIHGPLDDRVRTRILAEADGNPLALLELPRGLTPTAVAGGFGLPNPMPLAGRIEQEFLRQLEPLPDLTRHLLLLAAAEPVGDANLLRRAAAAQGIDMTPAAAPAEAAALIEIGARVRFRHPLVRSAVYRAAPVPDRRAAHAALADATDPDADPDRRAWHRAHAAPGPDEAVAQALQDSATSAQARGGVAAQAAFLARATELTPDPARRGGRALAAARATFESAAPEPALELLAVAELCPLDDLQRAGLQRLRGEIAFALRRGKDAPPLLLEAARALEPLDPAAAREVHLEALGAAMYSGRLAGDGEVARAAAAALAAPPAPSPRSIDLILDGMAQRFAEGPGAGVPALRTALRAFQDEALETHADAMRWLLLAPVVQSLVVFELWDDAAFSAVATRAVRLARDAGALTMLPVTLSYLSGVHLFQGELTTAAALQHEAETITAATGNTALVYGPMLLEAYRGDEPAARALIDAGRASATARGEGRVLALCGHASAILHNGLGHYDVALQGARLATDDPDQGYAAAAAVELVEAATRADRPDLAAQALPDLERRAEAAGTDWALGIAARARALTSDGDAAETAYREAIARLANTSMRLELARAQLVYGEWLRRENRRVDARVQLRAAHDALSRVGAEAFAERARRELSATGETLTRRDAAADARDALTPQEEQIARLAREGHSNPEIGAQLFISPRTVEYHLRKVFTKLGISSRRELDATLDGA